MKPVFLQLERPPSSEAFPASRPAPYMQEYELIDDASIVVCEHLYDNKLLDTYGNLQKVKEKKYGTIGVDVFNVL